MSINKVFISGNLTRDCELRATQGGTAVLTFGVAVNDRKRNQSTGEWEDYPNFVDCTMFGARAEAVNRYLQKGSKVAIEGKLRYSSWERDGQKRSKIEVIVDEIVFMSRMDADQREPDRYWEQGMRGPSAETPRNGSSAPVPQRQQPDIYDEDIPF